MTKKPSPFVPQGSRNSAPLQAAIAKAQNSEDRPCAEVLQPWDKHSRI